LVVLKGVDAFDDVGAIDNTHGIHLFLERLELLCAYSLAQGLDDNLVPRGEVGTEGCSPEFTLFEDFLLLWRAFIAVLSFGLPLWITRGIRRFHQSHRRMALAVWRFWEMAI